MFPLRTAKNVDEIHSAMLLYDFAEILHSLYQHTIFTLENGVQYANTVITVMRRQEEYCLVSPGSAAARLQ